MTWFLRVLDGNEFRDAAVLSGSHPLVIGRAPTADVSFPDDVEMSSRHATISLKADQCQFIDNQSTNGTYLNGERVTEGDLQPGDQLRCGTSIFCIDSANHSGSKPATAPKVKVTAANPPGSVTSTMISGRADNSLPTIPEEVLQSEHFVAETAELVVERFELAGKLKMTPQASEPVDKFALRLLHSEGDNDVLNFLACAMPKRPGIWWAVQCIRNEQSLVAAEDGPLLNLIEEWVYQPSESLRRQAMAVAEKLEMGTPAAWAGVAVFWAHGSMAPADAPCVPAKEEMTSKALAGSVILASVVRTPEHAAERRQSFTQLALKIASGELRWKSSAGA